MSKAFIIIKNPFTVTLTGYQCAYYNNTFIIIKPPFTVTLTGYQCAYYNNRLDKTKQKD